MLSVRVYRQSATSPVAWVEPHELARPTLNRPRKPAQWLKVRLEPAAHQDVVRHCDRLGVHLMRFYREAFSRGLTALIEDATQRTSGRPLSAPGAASEHRELPAISHSDDATEFALAAPLEPDAEQPHG
jgi:hypothetical protein